MISSANPALFSVSILPFCRAEYSLSQSQSLRKLMKSFYIYTHPYTYHRLLCSLSLSHTHTLRYAHSPLALSRPRKLHTHCGYDNSNPRLPTLSLPMYPPHLPRRLCRRKSRLSCLSTSFHLSLCGCVTGSVEEACETAGVEPSNGRISNTQKITGGHPLFNHIIPLVIIYYSWPFVNRSIIGLRLPFKLWASTNITFSTSSLSLSLSHKRSARLS